MSKRRNTKRRQRVRKRDLAVGAAFIIFLAVALSFALNPNVRGSVTRPTVPSEMTQQGSTSESYQISDSDREDLEAAFDKTLAQSCDGYVVKWKTYTENYDTFELTFIQDVDQKTDVEKQELMDKIGKLFDSQRQHYYGAGSYMHITFVTEDGKKFGASRMLFPEQYKLT